MERNLTLYDYLLAKCVITGCTCTGSVHVCRSYRAMAPEEIEESRLLQVRTFLATVIAISTSVQGAADLARKDTSLPHKSVRFPNEEPYLLGEQEAVEVSDTLLSSETITPANITNRFTPEIIESIIVCKCPKHKHCLTCHFPHRQWDRGLEEFILAPSRSRQTRWLAALIALDRATKIWVGEWADSVGWEKQNSCWVIERVYRPVRGGVHLSSGINDLKHNAMHSMANAMKKVVRYSGDCVRIMGVLRCAGESDDLEDIEHIEEVLNEQKDRVGNQLGKMMKGLSGLDVRIESLVKKLIKGFINNISWGPRHGRRKLEFIRAVLLRILKDVCDFRKQVEGIEAVWKGELLEPEEWFKKVEPSIGLFREWHGQIHRGLCDFANRGGRDRGCECDH